MTLEDQIHIKIKGIVLNQIAHDFGVDIDEMTPDLEDSLYTAIEVKMSYEAEIEKLLGPNSAMLDRISLIALAEQITLECLYDVDDQGLDAISGYISKFPNEMSMWHTHLQTFVS